MKDRLARLRRAFEVGSAHPTEPERLLRACGGDRSLFAEVRGLLENSGATGSFLAHPDIPTPGGDPWRDEWWSGRLIGRRYVLGVRLGVGGCGAVFQALDRLSGDQVAVKLVQFRDPEQQAQARREAAALQWLTLPGVPKLLDDGVSHGLAYFVTPIVSGTPFPGSRRPLTWSALQALLIALLEVLEGLHRSGLVHGDIKPANVLVSKDGSVTLLDLGISSGHALSPAPLWLRGGTPGYASPETLAGAPPTVQSDIYAVGVMGLQGAGLRRDPGSKVRRSLAPDLAERALRSMCAESTEDRPRDAAGAKRLIRGSVRGQPFLNRRLRLPSDMGQLFHGPERIFHVPTRAATLLEHRGCRTRTQIRRVIEDWQAQGLVSSRGTAVAITPDDMDSLEAQERSSSFKGSNTNGTARQSCRRQGLALSAARRACHAINAEVRDGRFFEAREHALATLRSLPHHTPTRAALLELVLRCAVASGTTRGFELLLYEIHRVENAGRATQRIESLARAGLLALRGDARRSLEAARDVIGVGGTSLQRLRHAVVIRAARWLPIASEAALVGRARRWARTVRSKDVQASVAEWEGWLAYRRGRYQEACVHHLRAGRLAPSASARTSSLLNASSAALDGFVLEEAEFLAQEGLREASLIRHPNHEARAEYLIRSARYRAEVPLTPDCELADAVAFLGEPHLEALVCLNEGAVAWRLGERSVALRLAARARECWRQVGMAPCAALAQALEVAAAGTCSAAEGRALMAAAEECPTPGLAIQIGGLAASASRAQAKGTFISLRQKVAALSRQPAHVRREVASIQECLAWLDASHRSGSMSAIAME